MQILNKKELNKISTIQGSILCFRFIFFNEQDIKYNQIACVTNKLGLIDKMYGCEDDIDLTENSVYYMFWNKLDWYRKDYYLVNLANTEIQIHHIGKLKASVIALYCLVGLITELLYELATGQERLFRRQADMD